MAEYRRLEKEDIPAHDADATALILEMGEHGWVGRLSSKGHAILRAPDGESTTSVARDSKRGRSGRNAKADFERWKRSLLKTVQEEVQVGHICKVCGEEFASGRALGAHSKKHIPGVPCGVCGKLVKYMGRHMATHEVAEEDKPLSQRLLELAEEIEQMERDHGSRANH